MRRAAGGELVTENYALCAALHWDPVEKKPLYHFYPGRQILSLGTYGCNLCCSFCQNWTLARGKPSAGGEMLTPQQVLAMLQREGSPAEVLGVAYTYNEPVVWYEFVYDTARLLHEHGYRNVLVTNGFISRAALRELLPYIDALNIDVKGFSDSFYRKYCHGMRRPVLETVELAASSAHVEVTCLLIPTLNDSPTELELFTSWLAGVNPNLPLHFSRYFPVQDGAAPDPAGNPAGGPGYSPAEAALRLPGQCGSSRRLRHPLPAVRRPAHCPPLLPGPHPPPCREPLPGLRGSHQHRGRIKLKA